MLRLPDIAAYDAAKARLGGGRDELVPASILDAMLAGENPTRVWHQYRGLTITQLAEKAGLSAAYVSRIETGARQGRTETMRALATALNVDLDDLT